MDVNTLPQSSPQEVRPADHLKAPIFREIPAPTQSENLPPELSTKIEGSSDRRVPAWDGIRGLAVLLVLAFHFLDIGYPKWLDPAGYLLLNWGWTGVDLFFVLSGFLITGILLDAKGSRKYFTNFYGRRAVRIFPAYYVLVVLILYVIPAIFPRLLTKGELPVFGPPWSYFLYVANYYYVLEGDAFGCLGHTWSLSAEEQFYLVWPAVVFLLSRRTLLRVCAGTVIGALLLRMVLLNHHATLSQVYLMSITRADSLALGAIVAILMRASDGLKHLKHTRWLLVVGPMIVAGMWVVKKKFPQTSWLEDSTKFTGIALFWAAFISMSVTMTPQSPLNKILAIRFLRFFGRYSYGIYLYHVPFYLAIKAYWGPPKNNWEIFYEDIIFVSGTILLALLSWHLLEKHMLKLKRFFPTNHGQQTSPAAGHVAPIAREM